MRFFALTARTTNQIVSAIGIPRINKMTSVIFFYSNTNSTPLRALCARMPYNYNYALWALWRD